MKFSVLMSIYVKEKEEYFNSAMLSIWDFQTVKPDEIILVQDGPLTNDLYESIERWSAKLSGVLKIVELEQNVGLGDALNLGLEHCSNELVARMDADDICDAERFSKQIDTFQNDTSLSICGTNILEFEGDINNVISTRCLPQLYSDILIASIKLNPFNHMSVMYKKSHIQNVGGYKHLPWMEDWYLWLRLMASGYKGINIPEYLVNARTGMSMISRRSGLKYIKSEWKLTKIKINLKLTSKSNACLIFIIRAIPRILPKVLLNRLYLFSRKISV